MVLWVGPSRASPALSFTFEKTMISFELDMPFSNTPLSGWWFQSILKCTKIWPSLLIISFLGSLSFGTSEILCRFCRCFGNHHSQFCMAKSSAVCEQRHVTGAVRLITALLHYTLQAQLSIRALPWNKSRLPGCAPRLSRDQQSIWSVYNI